MLIVSDGLQWEASLFQDDLIAAKTIEQLQAAKARFREEVRVWAMDAWKADGQYDAFLVKVERLLELAQLRESLI